VLAAQRVAEKRGGPYQVAVPQLRETEAPQPPGVGPGPAVCLGVGQVAVTGGDGGIPVPEEGAGHGPEHRRPEAVPAVAVYGCLKGLRG
jgi:hypothetical protein